MTDSLARRCLRMAALAGLMMLCAQGARAQCLDQNAVETLVAGYPNAPVTSLPAHLSLKDAYCTQEKYVAALRRRMGEPVGYKVGFTGKPTQERFGVSEPATGVLFEPMFMPDGSAIPRDFAHRPAIEPDLLVVVKDAGIMDATTELEAAAHLESVHALLELPAIQLAEGEAITGPRLVALNIGAVRFVMGFGAPVEATPDFVEALGAAETVFLDETGEVIQKAPASALMGHPLRVVLWLVKELKARGETLRPGDRLSLGSVGKLYPLAEGGKTYRYTLRGLPGGPLTTSVRIE